MEEMIGPEIEAVEEPAPQPHEAGNDTVSGEDLPTADELPTK